MKKRKIWTKTEIDVLIQEYPNVPTAELANRFETSLSSVYAQAYAHSLQKSDAFRQSDDSGRLLRGVRRSPATEFKPGGQPWNKGISYTAGGRSAETRFKPGRKPHTWHPIGHERVSKDGYLQRKTADTGYTPRDYVAVHHLVWAEHYGPVPAGHAIVFRDGNKNNFNIENLECVSRAELMRRNTVHRYPKEIALAVQLRGALNRKLNRFKDKS